MDSKTLQGIRHDLREYPQVKSRIPVWECELSKLQEELNAVRVSSPSVAATGCRSRSADSIVERQAIRHERITARMADIALDIRDARLFLWRIDNAFKALSDFDKSILLSHYVQGASWIHIADDIGYSESSIRVYGRRAMDRLARALYRPTASMRAKMEA